jgi:hypothetical protein
VGVQSAKHYNIEFCCVVIFISNARFSGKYKPKILAPPERSEFKHLDEALVWSR